MNVLLTKSTTVPVAVFLATLCCFAPARAGKEEVLKEERSSDKASASPPSAAAEPPLTEPPLTESPPPSGKGADGRYPLELRGGFGEGIELRAGEDLFSIQFRGRVQMRLVSAASLPRGPNLNAFEAEYQASLPRVRLTVGGEFLNGAISYYGHIGVGPSDFKDGPGTGMRDFYFTWHALRELNIQVGQSKVLFDRQFVNSSSTLQFVRRSVAVRELKLNRDIGVHATSNDVLGLGWLSYRAGLFAGKGANRLDPNLGGLLMGRLQITPLGTFDDLSGGDFARHPTPKFAAAIAAAYNLDASRTRSTMGDDAGDRRFSFLHLTSDFSTKWYGFSLTGAVLYRQATQSFAITDKVGPDARTAICGINDVNDDCGRSGIGGHLQAGAMVLDRFELAARAAYVETWETQSWIWERGTDRLYVAELTGAASMFLVGHNLKLQTDASLLPSSQGLDMRVRAQLQLYF